MGVNTSPHRLEKFGESTIWRGGRNDAEEIKPKAAYPISKIIFPQHLFRTWPHNNARDFTLFACHIVNRYNCLERSFNFLDAFPIAFPSRLTFLRHFPLTASRQSSANRLANSLSRCEFNKIRYHTHCVARIRQH